MVQKLKGIRFQNMDPEKVIFYLFLLAMALYYGWRLFVLTPWYDELYTYYYFISRGSVYAAIHWPLPNNHVGYSVLSGFLDLFGNSAVGLRGISYLSSLLSLWLLYWIGRNCFPKGVALMPPCLFASMELVNQMAAQGRGYALITCLYLTALCCLVKIVIYKEKKIRYYLVFGVSLIWSLYTVASSVYFVLPLCAAGGIALLYEKRFRDFWKLVGISFCSAICTAGLYGIIWLAIGSNLLSKTDGSDYFGLGHVQIILHAPFAAARAGIGYMLGMPYIQSVERQGYLSALGNYIRTLFNYYYNGFAYILIGAAGIVLIAIICRLILRNAMFMEWYLLISFLMTPLMLIIQSALPYYRVFSYFGAAVALMCTWLVSKCIQLIHMQPEHREHGLFKILSVITVLITVKALFLPLSGVPYSARETAIEEAYLAIDMSRYEKIAVADCDQEYLLKYMYGLDMEDDSNVRLTPSIEDADCVLLDRDLLLPEGQYTTGNSAGEEWKFYVTRDNLPVTYLEENMQAVYENDRFVFYVRKY